VPHYAPVLYPSSQSWLGAARERIVGSPVLPVATIPVDGGDYSPEDTPEFLRDTGLRASEALVYGDVLGPESAVFAYGGAAFLDTDGYFLDNVFGDLSTVSNGTLGAARVLSAALNVGDTSLTVGVSLGSVVTGSIIQISDGAASEIVVATAGSSGTAVNFTSTPCRFAHSVSATAALQTAASNYSHTFAVLNSGSGQPPTHSLTDYTGITPTVGARAYPGSCVAEMDFTGLAGQGLDRKVSGLSWPSVPASSTPVAVVSATPPVAGWQCTVSIGGSAVYNVGAWSASFKRQLLAKWSAQGSQSPWLIIRGGLAVTFSMDFGPAVSEAPLTDMTNGVPLAVVFQLSNGLSGASKLSFTLTATTAQAVKSAPVRSSEAIGYSTEWEALGNSTDAGGSGGLGPATVTLVNSTATY
jgi:hypothetical protein